MPQKLFEAEYKFMELVWETAPVSSTALAALAAGRLSWKKSTTYTVLRKLCEKNVLQNKDAIVTALLTKDEVLRAEGEELLQKSGGMPLFLTAFFSGRKLTEEERTALQKLLDESNGG